MPEFKKGERYNIIFKIGEDVLRYSCIIISFDGIFLTFKDKYDKVYTYNINSIISYSEESNGKS